MLGQFDPFYTGPVGPQGGMYGGRLLLVAPNVVHVERELGVDPHDFRLWVCLHEETHRVQFTAVPWLRGYLNTQIGEVVATADVDGAASRASASSSRATRTRHCSTSSRPPSRRQASNA